MLQDQRSWDMRVREVCESLCSIAVAAGVRVLLAPTPAVLLSLGVIAAAVGRGGAAGAAATPATPASLLLLAPAPFLVAALVPPHPCLVVAVSVVAVVIVAPEDLLFVASQSLLLVVPALAVAAVRRASPLPSLPVALLFLFLLSSPLLLIIIIIIILFAVAVRALGLTALILLVTWAKRNKRGSVSGTVRNLYTLLCLTGCIHNSI